MNTGGSLINKIESCGCVRPITPVSPPRVWLAKHTVHFELLCNVSHLFILFLISNFILL